MCPLIARDITRSTNKYFLRTAIVLHERIDLKITSMLSLKLKIKLTLVLNSLYLVLETENRILIKGIIRILYSTHMKFVLIIL